MNPKATDAANTSATALSLPARPMHGDDARTLFGCVSSPVDIETAADLGLDLGARPRERAQLFQVQKQFFPVDC
ncbi:hypothetical protein CEXT_708211 [Caerostris extrusa]|uniref:Uncharacterized protein n=1 Tax=Caerostris extrusa TaxID=172846 RepID=A0AAV4Q5W3_CAEEX|nr:hypothetical protein CEXT_708211 [Caerostris extrusa]